MVRTAGGIRISGGKSLKKSSGCTAPTSSSSSGSHKSSSSQASGSRLPPIPHTDVPSWQKSITVFFNTGGPKNQDKCVDPDEKTKQDTLASKTQQTSDEQNEPVHGSSSSNIAGIETDSQGKSSASNNELISNDETGCSTAADASNTKVGNNSFEDPLHKPATDSPGKEENYDEDNESANEITVKPKEHESVSEPSVEDIGCMGKQNKILADVSNKIIGITEALNKKNISCDENSESMSKQVVKRYSSDQKLHENLADVSSENAVGGRVIEEVIDGEEKLCEKEAESWDGEKGDVEGKYGEPAAKKMKT